MSVATLIIPCLLLVHISQSVAVRSAQNVLMSEFVTTNTSEHLFMYSELRGLSTYPDVLADALFVRAGAKAGVISRDYTEFRTLLRGEKLTQDPEFIKMMGPFDSGTNFIFRFCSLNDIKISDVPYGEPCPNCHGWKHWPLQIEPLPMKVDGRFNLMIVRHPLSWLLSIRKHPYDITCLDWDNFSDCYFDFQREVDQDNDSKRGFGTFVSADNKMYVSNLIEIWNMYGRGYLNTNIPGMILRYEDFLAHPQDILTEIKKQTGLPVVNAYVPMVQSAKEGVEARGFEAAKQYNLNKQFMEQYDERLLEHIKHNVDLEVMEKLGYSF